MDINIYMYFYTGITLVDITATGVIRHTAANELQRNQQRNWETVLQCISIKAQPQLIEGPYCKQVIVDQTTAFPDIYFGEQRVWFFSFGVDYEDVFLEKDDPVGALDSTFSKVPIICGLDETARFMLPIFYPYGAIKNILFMKGRMNLNTI
jgi:hypothetical protein